MELKDYPLFAKNKTEYKEYWQVLTDITKKLSDKSEQVFKSIKDFNKKIITDINHDISESIAKDNSEQSKANRYAFWETMKDIFKLVEKQQLAIVAIDKAQQQLILLKTPKINIQSPASWLAQSYLIYIDYSFGVDIIFQTRKLGTERFFILMDLVYGNKKPIDFKVLFDTKEPPLTILEHPVYAEYIKKGYKLIFSRNKDDSPTHNNLNKRVYLSKVIESAHDKEHRVLQIIHISFDHNLTTKELSIDYTDLEVYTLEAAKGLMDIYSAVTLQNADDAFLTIWEEVENQKEQANHTKGVH